MGREVNKRLTPRERTFAKAYAQTRDVQAAEIKAGYADGYTYGYKLMKKPEIAAAVEAETAKILANQLAPMALNTLAKILKDPKEKGSTKVSAAKVVLSENRLYNAAGDGEKPLEDMTPAERSAYQAKLQTMLDALDLQARTIEGEAIDVAPGDDIFD